MTRLMSAAEAEREFNIDGLAHRVRVWRNRKRLHPSGLDSSGRPLYRESAIRELLDTPKH